MPRITPFREDGKSVGIDDLTIENRADSVEMFGSLSITKDKDGLKRVRELKEIVDATLTALETDKDLPAKIEKLSPKKKQNPFA